MQNYQKNAAARFRLFYKAEQLPVRDAYEHARQRDEVVCEAVAHALRKIELVVAARRGEAREVVDVLIAREPRLAEDVGAHREYPRADAAGLAEGREHDDVEREAGQRVDDDEARRDHRARDGRKEQVRVGDYARERRGEVVADPFVYSDNADGVRHVYRAADECYEAP